MAVTEQTIKKIEKRIDALEKIIKTLPNMIEKKEDVRAQKQKAIIIQQFNTVLKQQTKLQDDLLDTQKTTMNRLNILMNKIIALEKNPQN